MPEKIVWGCLESGVEFAVELFFDEEGDECVDIGGWDEGDGDGDGDEGEDEKCDVWVCDIW